MDQEKDLREDVQEELYEEEEEVYGEEETQEETSRAQRKPNDPLQLVNRCIEEMIDYVENAKRVFGL